MKKFLRIVKIIAIIFAIVLLAVTILINIIFLFSIRKNVEHNTQQQSMHTKTLLQLIDDTREIRNTLTIGNLVYELEGNDSQIYATPPATDQLYLQIEEIQRNYKNEQDSIIVKHFIDNKILNNVLATLDVTLQQKNISLILRYNNAIVGDFKVLINSEGTIDGIKYYSKVIQEGTLKTIEDLTNTIRTIDTAIKNNEVQSKKLRTVLFNELATNDMKIFLKKNRAQWRYHTNNDIYYTWVFTNAINEEVLTISLNSITFASDVNGKTESKQLSYRQKKAFLVKEIYNSSYSTRQNTITMSALQHLQNVLQTENFINKLKQENLTIDNTVREDADYFYHTILSNSTKIGAFAVQKNNGQYWMVDKDDVLITSFNLSTQVAPHAPNAPALPSRNILLIGRHNNLADTILLVHLTDNNRIKLVSIPRDLYISGRKINWYAKFFSLAKFTALVSKITGVPINKYIDVDMYAFSAVIDMIGGINVYLKDDLIDPTYKIKENGSWTYLSYQKGEHHLNGIETLRIARSRNTSDDFSRSERQQIILEGIKEKINQVNMFSSMLSLIKIISKVSPYIDTNIKTLDMAKMIAQHRNASFSNKLVLSTNNILYYTFSNVKAQNLDKHNIPDDFDNGAYILLPKNDDWNGLQNYIEQFILQ